MGHRGLKAGTPRCLTGLYEKVTFEMIALGQGKDPHPFPMGIRQVKHKALRLDKVLCFGDRRMLVGLWQSRGPSMRP